MLDLECFECGFVAKIDADEDIVEYCPCCASTDIELTNDEANPEEE
jgi:Zn finger protein HypA/HybF involved in hydrogenase expression